MELREHSENVGVSINSAEPPAQVPVSGPVGTVESLDRPSATAWYGLAMLAVANFFALIDRQAIVVLLQPIKTDLRASDAEMALLTGLAFTVLFTVFGILVARWVDVGVRKSIMSLAIFAWSAMTALSAAATNVLQFGLTRAGLGIAESAVMPGAVSMVGDLFPRSWRHRALSLFYTGGALTPAIGAPVAAILGERYGWRTALLVFAIGGMVLAAIFWLTVKEPLRGRFDAGPASKKDAAPPSGLVLRTIFTNKALLLHFFSLTLASVALGAFATWLTPFAMRVHGLSLTDAGVLTGIAGVVIIVSIPVGGWICSWLTARSVDDRQAIGFCALATLAAVPTFFIGFAAEAYTPFVVFTLLTLAFAFMRMSPAMSLAADMAPPQMRGMVTAIMVAGSSLLGSGLAPIVIGAISDRLTRDLGSAEGLRWALLYSLPGPMVLAAVLGWWSMRYIQPRATNSQA